ncbi:hypothetical protein EVAR_38225_1 [Eumeta japonica]|uniref:Uncharacterized protein n=1 Tax=Eumeta variegata TaxID=151549 RepID=A0A4C1XGB5_EUMVA|nr:hypothetical protein EVAR_38225_1 [Eumeta japonica]
MAFGGRSPIGARVALIGLKLERLKVSLRLKENSCSTSPRRSAGGAGGAPPGRRPPLRRLPTYWSRKSRKICCAKCRLNTERRSSAIRGRARL